MVEIAVKIVLCLSIAALIGFFIGLIVGKSGRRVPLRKDQKINPVFKKQGNIYNKPLILGVPRPKGRDDLQKIDGVTSVLEEKLNDLGIYHFDQIAKWSIKNAEWVEEYLDIQGQILEESWIDKAKDI